ncbi:MAG: hypothetical protein O9308_01375 [Beijerinckiaceae bacterium]|nr:hypothetical protein [Beijerinckiaceae bacterium]
MKTFVSRQGWFGPRMAAFRAGSVAALAGLAVCMAVAGAQAQANRPAAAPANRPAANAAPAGGAQTFLIGTFNDWRALTTGKDKQKMCYALSEPKERLPKTLKRDPGYLFISTRAADGARNEVAFKLGFAAKNGQDGTLTIGTASFALVASGESAFLKNPAQEAQLIEQMKRAQSISIKVASARGNETTDRYSMNGFARAIEAVAKECP